MVVYLTDEYEHIAWYNRKNSLASNDSKPLRPLLLHNSQSYHSLPYILIPLPLTHFEQSLP